MSFLQVQLRAICQYTIFGIKSTICNLYSRNLKDHTRGRTGAPCTVIRTKNKALITSWGNKPFVTCTCFVSECLWTWKSNMSVLKGTKCSKALSSLTAGCVTFTVYEPKTSNSGDWNLHCKQQTPGESL